MMQSLVLSCALFQAFCLITADHSLIYDGIISVLLKKIWELEQRDLELYRKLDELDLIKERLDDAQSRLANMQELEYRLLKAEERIRILNNRWDNNDAGCRVNKSDTETLFDTKRTNDNIDIDSADSANLRRAVSKRKALQGEMSEKLATLKSFKIRTDKADAAHTKAIRTASARRVAFSVRFSSSEVLLHPGHPLVFDLVEINQGNGYENVSGFFTCPISGAYFFYTNVLTVGPTSNRVGTEIVLDGVGKAKTLVSNPDIFDQGSAVVITHCGAGHKVWIRTTVGSITYGAAYTSFSGFLISEDADAMFISR
ncbi:hypothetical protein CHS0354_042299 [Potamilus streckersoni]|uniref:C1q domain-containing protein n=1 Tax=Potamilus streckersoni TaxID=2493646 RepID=A0AAE0STI4_9BIVA|nr:hypothetical protein CHS0354_042299 [Potamilus streckersoni]